MPGVAWEPPGRPGRRKGDQRKLQARRERRRRTDRLVAAAVLLVLVVVGLLAAVTLGDDIATEVQGRLIERESTPARP